MAGSAFSELGDLDWNIFEWPPLRAVSIRLNRPKAREARFKWPCDSPAQSHSRALANLMVSRKRIAYCIVGAPKGGIMSRRSERPKCNDKDKDELRNVVRAGVGPPGRPMSQYSAHGFGRSY
jgi:hypothetical protein